MEWRANLQIETNCIEDPLMTLLSSYLSNRKQWVVLNGSNSGWASIESGVPQWSIYYLFLILINDLEANLKSSIKFFADDTLLYSMVSNPLLSAEELNVVSKWANQWKVSCNSGPNKQAVEIIFSLKRVKPRHLNDSLVKPALAISI